MFVETFMVYYKEYNLIIYDDFKIGQSECTNADWKSCQTGKLSVKYRKKRMFITDQVHFLGNPTSGIIKEDHTHISCFHNPLHKTQFLFQLRFNSIWNPLPDDLLFHCVTLKLLYDASACQVK